MQYLTYEEYTEIGGTLKETAFNRNIDRVCGFLANETHKRIDGMRDIPQEVKACCRDLLDYVATVTNERGVTSKSQSAGGVSESESYATKTADDVYGDIQNMIYDYLLNVTDYNGTPLLYRGCSR